MAPSWVMFAVIRLILCRYTASDDPHGVSGCRAVPAETLPFRQEVTITHLTLEEVLRDLQEERVIYRTALVGKGRDKLAVEPQDKVHRVVGDDGAAWLATSPDDTTRDNLSALPTRRALDRWILAHSPTMAPHSGR